MNTSIVHVYTELKNPEQSIDLRSKIALFAWRDNRVVMPGNKYSFLLSWLQSILVDNIDNENLWKILLHFLETLPSDDLFIQNKKLSFYLVKAMESDNITAAKCTQCIWNLLDVTIIMYCDLIQKIESMLHCNTDVMVEEAYSRISKIQDINVILNKLGSLSEDVHKRNILNIADPTLIPIIFKYKPMLLIDLCRKDCPLFIEECIKLATTKPMKNIDLNDWWLQIFDLLESNPKIRIDAETLLIVSRKCPQLLDRIVAMCPSVFYQLPVSKQFASQSEFIRNAQSLSLSQLMSLEMLKLEGPALFAFEERASKADKLELVQAIRECKNVELVECLLSSAHLSDIVFVEDIRMQMIESLKQFQSPLVIRTLSMLGSFNPEWARYADYALRYNYKIKDYTKTTNADSTIRFYIQLMCSKANDLNRCLISHAERCRSYTNIRINMDVFTSIEHLTFFLRRILSAFIPDHVLWCWRGVCKYKLPSDIALEMLRVNSKIWKDANVARSLFKSITGKSDEIKAVEYIEECNVNRKVLLNASLFIARNLEPNVISVMKPDCRFIYCVLNSKQIDTSHLNDIIANIDLEQSVIDLVLKYDFINPLLTFFEKLSESNKQKLVDANPAQFGLLSKSSEDFNDDQKNEKLIQACVTMSSEDIFLIEFILFKYHLKLDVASKQALLSILPEVDLDLAMRIIRRYPGYYRTIPSVFCSCVGHLINSFLSQNQFYAMEELMSGVMKILDEPLKPPNATIPLTMLLFNIVTSFVEQRPNDYRSLFTTNASVRKMLFDILQKCDRVMFSHGISCARIIKHENYLVIIKALEDVFEDFIENGRFDRKI